MNHRDAQHLLDTAPPAESIDARLARMEARQIRIETRLVLLMLDHGLDVNGKKHIDQPTKEPTP